MDVAAFKQLGVVHLRAGQVGNQHTEGDGQQQQRFILLVDGQIEEEAGHQDHDPLAAGDDLGKHHFRKEFLDGVADVQIEQRFHLSFIPFRA